MCVCVTLTFSETHMMENSPMVFFTRTSMLSFFFPFLSVISLFDSPVVWHSSLCRAKKELKILHATNGLEGSPVSPWQFVCNSSALGLYLFCETVSHPTTAFDVMSQSRPCKARNVGLCQSRVRLTWLIDSEEIIKKASYFLCFNWTKY